VPEGRADRLGDPLRLVPGEDEERPFR